MKMYILIRECIPTGHAVNCAAHASLATYLKFKDHPSMVEWLETSFRKVTCVVTDEEFEEAKSYDDSVLIIEDALKDAEVCLGFKPRKEWPSFFRKLRLFGS